MRVDDDSGGELSGKLSENMNLSWQEGNEEKMKKSVSAMKRED